MPWTAGPTSYRGRHFLAIYGPSRRPTACHAADRCLARGGALVRHRAWERKAKNLAENPSCVLTTGRSDLVEGALDVVLEGRASR